MTDNPVERLAKIDGVFARKIVRFSEANPEQQFAYALASLVEQQKATLELMQTTNLLAQHCVEWRKSPEGVSWVTQKMLKRAGALELLEK